MSSDFTIRRHKNQFRHGLRELVHGTQGLTVPVIEIILRENTRLTLRERQEVALIIKNLELT